MDVSNLSVNYAQNRLLNEVSIAVLAISLREFRQNAEQMQHLLESADKLSQTVRDASLGKQVDLVG